MSNCNCNGECQTNKDYVCKCDDCKCGKNKRTYVYDKDHGHDISYENEVNYD